MKTLAFYYKNGTVLKMSPKIVLANEYASVLEQKYAGLKIPLYKLREWFSDEREVFFDCDADDAESCLPGIMTKPDFNAFIVFILFKDASTGGFGFMDVNFRNLGKETLEHFITRYHQQLEQMTKLSLQTALREYVACLGHSYE